MRRENEFGGVYHEISFPSDHLLIIRDLCLSIYDAADPNDFDVSLLLIADRIEKELGIE